MKILKLKQTLLAPMLCISIIACKQESQKKIAKAEIKTEVVPAINLSNLDTLVKPSDDFFTYANGTWVKKAKIPADKGRWGTFDELRKKTDKDALTILASAMSTNDKDVTKIKVLPGSDQEKAVNLFQTIMDTVTRNKQGIKPLQPLIADINAIKTVTDLQSFLTKMEPMGGVGLFGLYIGADLKDSNKNTIYVVPGALGLPDRDYYIKNDSDSKEKRDKYVTHVARMLQFLGDAPDKAKQQAQQILDFETRLAKPMLDKVEQRDARKTYNPMAIAQLQKLMPAINWDAYLKTLGVKNVNTIVVSQPKYIKALQAILAENKVENWKTFLRWSVLNQAASSLSSTIETANWEFYKKALRGEKEQKPRDERALQTLNATIGEALGKLYVDKKFPKEAKAKAEKIIKNVFLAYETRINALPWMSEDTKKKAIEKLRATKIKIAYPDKWKDYSKLEVKGTAEGGTYFQNMLNAAQWNFNKSIDKLDKPVDKSEWYMAPQIVNAYFNPTYNEIVFPAGILQPPYFNFNADDAVNYGAIGAVIGHEISHSFDDSGARFDKDGNLNNWWTDKDLKQFEALGEKLAKQYDAIEVLPGITINGKFTLGENIGDLGGVNAAYDALQLSLKENRNPGKIDGFTPEQRFFLSWATSWRTKTRDDEAKTLIKTDPHSPGQTRAVQPLRNIDAFYTAFNIKEGDALYIKPEDRVKIW